MNAPAAYLGNSFTFGNVALLPTFSGAKDSIAEVLLCGVTEYSPVSHFSLVEAADRASCREHAPLISELHPLANKDATQLDKPELQGIATPIVSEKVFNKLPIDKKLISNYRQAYNGTGLDKLTTWLLGGRISDDQAESILSDAVEDALIGVYFGLNGGRPGRPVEIMDKDLILLHAAIEARLPRLDPPRRGEVAKRLALVLREALCQGEILLIDGAAVGLSRGGIYISPHCAGKSVISIATEPTYKNGDNNRQHA